jgi:membrane protein
MRLRLLVRARRFWRGLNSFLGGFDDHALYSHAAATGFFLFFSIPPAVLALVSLASLLPVERIVNFAATEGHEWLLDRVQHTLEPAAGAVAARIVQNALGPWFEQFAEVRGTALVDQLRSLLELNLPPAVAGPAGQLVEDVLEAPRPGLVTIGFLALLWTASGATRMAMRALNAIYEVRRHAFVRRILVSVSLTLAILAGASTTLTALPLGNTVAQAVVDFFDFPSVVLGLWGAFNWMVGISFMLVVVCALLLYGPNARLGLRDVAPGAVLTVVLWVVLGVALRVWTSFGWERTNATYGALAAVIVLLLWCYLVSAALLIGGEVNAWYVEHRGRSQRAVGGLALPYARRWPPLGPYVPGPRLVLMRRFVRRLRPARVQAALRGGKRRPTRPPQG